MAVHHENHENHENHEKRFAEIAKTTRSSLLRDLFGLLAANKKWWLLPILVTLLFISGLLLLSGTAAGPFIYTLF